MKISTQVNCQTSVSNKDMLLKKCRKLDFGLTITIIMEYTHNAIYWFDFRDFVSTCIEKQAENLNN